MSLVPADPPAPVDAMAALAAADQVVIGPGSLFTSVLAAVAVPASGRASPGRRPGGLRRQPPPRGPETAGFDVADHVAALAGHGVAVDVVVADTSALALGTPGVEVVDTRLAKANGRAHDPTRLASAPRRLVG